jgi:hybrid cluster-associated redox disulfide protein
MTQENKITKEMTFGEVLSKYPETVKTFFMYGMHCFGCHLAVDETIEQGALAHGVDVDKLMKDLNETAASTEEVKETSTQEEKKEL